MDDVGGSCCPALARPLVDTLWHPTVSVQKSRCLPASRFNDLEGCKQGCMYLPDNIGERPWPMALLQSLAAGLRKMAGELDSSDKGGLAMSNVVEFPTTEKPITEDEIDKLHSGAFRDLESGISDCVHMASIAVQMAEHAIEGRDDKHEKAMFAVFQVTVVLKKLKADYYAAWHGERRST